MFDQFHGSVCRCCIESKHWLVRSRADTHTSDSMKPSGVQLLLVVSIGHVACVDTNDA